MSQLTDYLAGLSKDKIDAFASEYFGVSLDKRQTKDVMINTLAEAVTDKDPLKQLPYEELLLEKTQSPVVEEVALDATTETVSLEIDVEEVVHSAVVPGSINEETAQETLSETAEVEVTETAEVAQVTETAEVKVTEASESQVQPDEYNHLFKPSFELVFKNGADKFTVIGYQVTDFIEKLKDGTATMDDIDPKLSADIKTVIYYAKRYGSVMVRETRNSRFLNYFATDFESISI